MKKKSNNSRDLDDLDRLLEEITLDAYGDDEQLWAFRQAFADSIAVPCDGLVILSLKENAAHCRLLGSNRIVTLRASRLWDVVPGEIAVVKPRKQRSYAGHPSLSGEIETTRLDVPALGGDTETAKRTGRPARVPSRACHAIAV